MAVFQINRGPAHAEPEIDADTLFRHYEATGFLYEAKRERLAPFWPQITAGWNRLLRAPADLFELHAATENDDFVSSLCTYQDCPGTFAVEHASSKHRPLRMLECMLSAVCVASGIPDIQTCALYFRPQNAWPHTLVARTRPQYPPGLTSLRTFSYLLSQPSAITVKGVPCKELGGAEALEAVSSVVAAWLGDPEEHRLWLTANGFAVAGAMEQLTVRFAEHGVHRSRRVYAAYRDGQVAGVAVGYASNVPLNLSFLCNRLEVFVRPDAPDRMSLVRELAARVQRDAAASRAPILSALVEPQDEQALVSAGFQTTSRQYTKFTWGREGERAFTASAITIVEWYGEMHRLDAARAH